MTDFKTRELVSMAKGDEPVYRGTLEDSDRHKVGDVSLWKNESKNGLSYLGGIVTKRDGSTYRIVLFEAKKGESGKSAHPLH